MSFFGCLPVCLAGQRCTINDLYSLYASQSVVLATRLVLGLAANWWRRGTASGQVVFSNKFHFSRLLLLPSRTVFVVFMVSFVLVTCQSLLRAVLNAAIFFPNIASKCLEPRGGPYYKQPGMKLPKRTPATRVCFTPSLITRG